MVQTINLRAIGKTTAKHDEDDDGVPEQKDIIPERYIDLHMQNKQTQINKNKS